MTFFLLVLVSLKSILEHNFLLLSEHNLHQFILYLGFRRLYRVKYDLLFVDAVHYVTDFVNFTEEKLDKLRQ